VDAAISGRVLLSTLHCRDAVSAVTALRNWGLHDHEIAEALTVVVGQRLVRRLCPRCRVDRAITEKERHWFSAVGLSAPKRVADGAGCAECAHLGFSGRTGIFEMWRLNEQDYQAILEHADEHALRRTLAKRKHHSILADGLAKVIAGVTSVSELRRASSGAFPSSQLLAGAILPRRNLKQIQRAPLQPAGPALARDNGSVCRLD
jgi:type II secretory ATPase GspE/PulE/Tfp pilus assembly ATPase PilB-like protein